MIQTMKCNSVRFLKLAVLLFSSLLWFFLSWGAWVVTQNGIDSTMMGFEAMPIERHDEIRWYFVQERLPENFLIGGIFFVLGIVLAWRWRLFFRSLRKPQFVIVNSAWTDGTDPKIHK
jgi:hypothetical protein